MSAKRYLYDKDFKACDNCRGKGTVHCGLCGGKGYCEVRRSRHEFSAHYYSETERENCVQCRGTGESPCIYCAGTGDQLRYDTGGAAEADETSPDDLRESDAPPSKAEYAALYEEKLHEAEGERDRIVEWIWDAHVFTTQQKSHLANWLGDLVLTYPGAINALNETAEDLDHPGSATQAQTLALKLRRLASTCGMIDLYADARK